VLLDLFRCVRVPRICNSSRNEKIPTHSDDDTVRALERCDPRVEIGFVLSPIVHVLENSHCPLLPNHADTPVVFPEIVGTNSDCQFVHFRFRLPQARPFLESIQDLYDCANYVEKTIENAECAIFTVSPTVPSRPTGMLSRRGVDETGWILLTELVEVVQ
jgi:hypothetical protein